MDFKDKIKQLIDKLTNKKFINNIIIFLIIGIILLITSSIFTNNKDDNKVTSNQEIKEESYDVIQQNNYSVELEKKLKRILSQMKGVGKVDVMITLENTAEKIPAVDTTQDDEKTSEKDSQGGIREIIRENSTSKIVTKGSDGSLVILKEIKPDVKGVIVIAQGASDIEVKEKLYEAVKTVLGISGNKVEIYCGE